MDTHSFDIQLAILQSSVAGRWMLAKYHFCNKRYLAGLCQIIRRVRTTLDTPLLRVQEDNGRHWLVQGCYKFLVSKDHLESTWTGRFLLLEGHQNWYFEASKFIFNDIKGYFDYS